jgi:hypothetical protein
MLLAPIGSRRVLDSCSPRNVRILRRHTERREDDIALCLCPVPGSVKVMRHFHCGESKVEEDVQVHSVDVVVMRIELIRSATKSETNRSRPSRMLCDCGSRVGG